jgi:hypothetical protein
MEITSDILARWKKDHECPDSDCLKEQGIHGKAVVMELVFVFPDGLSLFRCPACKTVKVFP